jgi:hypothetical protein
MVISCMADPRCRADFPEDEAPRGVHGVIPSWKMMTATYVRPCASPVLCES